MRKLVWVSLLGLGWSATAVAAPMNVQVLHATIKNTKVADAEVIVQRQSETSVKGKTDKEGAAQLTSQFPDDAATTLIIK